MRLDEAATFLGVRSGKCRAVGFFSDQLNAPEHTVFLTVAKRVAEPASHPLTVELGRSTVGRGTSGASIYLVPVASAVAPNGSAVAAAVLIHQYRVPASPSDASLPARWRKLATGRTVSPPPSTQMWEEVLEAEASRLDRFLRRGALADVSELTAETLPTLTAGAHTLGLLLWPTAHGALSPRLRAYYLRRLHKLAVAYAPLDCANKADAQSTPEAPDDAPRRSGPWTAWLPGHAECTTRRPAKAVRFAHAFANMSLVGALLAAKIDMPYGELVPHDAAHVRDVRFAVMRRQRASAEGGSKWGAQLHLGAVTVDESMRRALGLAPPPVDDVDEQEQPKSADDQAQGQPHPTHDEI